ncbi:MAG: hypothetical protein GY855_16895 [candidate division Zixibacteria bacterium]|nr:hypothetical protein [candidate division Zixibacteria bacterium]
MNISTKPTRTSFIRLSLLVAFQLLLLFTMVQSQGIETEDETCLACHEEYDKTLSFTRHRLKSEIHNSRTDIACRSCHTGASEHVDDPMATNIGNPSKALAMETELICTKCHQPHPELRVAGFDSHSGIDVSCTSCHRIHSTNSYQLIDEEGKFCGVCHVSIVNEFRKESNHPLTDQALTCMSCHDFTGRNEMDFGHGGNANCYRCHPEQSGPYLYEHEAVSSFSTQGEGCTECHQSHGSPNERLLNQPDNRLCLQCHGIPPLHLVWHNGVGSQHECVDCHSDFHGSYSNRAFLDPLLGIKLGGASGSCYCHNVND